MLGKYYKPNNSTLLYLNSSFNCKKSSTITLALTSAGAGYIAAPTITITTAEGDTGSGASATCVLNSIRIQSTIPINSGTGYAVGDVLIFNNEGTGMITSAAAYVASVNTNGGIAGIYYTNRGSYTIKAPVVTSLTSVNGTGAIINFTMTTASINSITITNNGSGYNKLPTITLSGGNPTTPAVITPSFLKTYSYTWDIPNTIEINDLAKLSAVNIVATGTNNTTQYTYKIKNLLYDVRDSYFSENDEPILSIAQNTNITSRGSLQGAGEFAIILKPQTIKEITLIVDDDITTKGSGQSANINFVIALKIIEFNPTYQEKTDVYEEAAANRLRPHF